MSRKAALRAGLRLFWSLALLALVALAVALQVGRLILPEIHQYRTEVAALLARAMDAEVTIGRLEGRWRGLRPQVTAFDIAISQDGKRVLGAARADLEVNALLALFDWQDGLRRLAFHRLYTTLSQRESGSWGIKHLRPRASSGSMEFGDPLDLFLLGRRIALTETVVEIEFFRGPATQIRIPEITLENDAQFHRLAALARVDGAPALRLVLEGEGDPRRPQFFRGQAYLALQSLPTGRALRSLAALPPYQRLPASLREGLERGGRVSTELWFNFGGGRGLIWQGDFDLKVPPLAVAEARLPGRISGQVAGFSRAGELAVQLSDLALDMPAAPPPFMVSLYSSANGDRQLRTRDIDLARWRAAAIGNGWLTGGAREWAEGLAPAGWARRAAVDLPADGPWRLAASLEQAQVEAFRGVPALSGVSATLELGAEGGRAQLHSEGDIGFALPGLYEQPLQFHRAAGPVSWAFGHSQRRLGIEIGPLELSNPELEGVVRLALDIPLQADAVRPAAMTLTVGIPVARASDYARYTPAALPDPARLWLAQSAPAGNLSQIGVIFRGELRPGGNRHLELGFEFDDLGLLFAPGWPRIDSSSGSFGLRNQSVTAIGNAELAGLEIQRARLQIEPGTPGPMLELAASLSGRAGEALALIPASPLAKPLDFMADWRGHGALQAELALTLPLSEPDAPEVALALQLDQVGLVLPGDLTIANIHGQLTYDAAGVNSNTLRGQVLGRSFEAQFATAEDTSELRFDGRAPISALANWLSRPELATFSSGEAAVSGHLLLPSGGKQPPVLHLSSDLVGVESVLPHPFGKSATEVRHFEGQVTLSEPRETRLKMGDIAQLVLVQAEGELEGLALGLLDAEPRYRPGIISFNGRLPADDWPAWRALLERHRSAGGGAVAGDGASAGALKLPVRANLIFDGLELGPLALDGINLSAASRPDGWLVRLNHPRLKGTVQVSDVAGTPIQVSLTRLALPMVGEVEAPSEDLSAELPLADFQLEQIPPLDLRIAALSIGKWSLGEWRGRLRPIPGGLHGFDIAGAGPVFKLEGRDSATAELLWLKSEAAELTYFEGRLTAQDVGEALTEFGYPRLLESEAAALDLELTWSGGPTAIALDRLRGTAGVELNRGRFIRGAGAGENPLLKLIGLLNFDTLARRLRLDFSDLKAEGMAFEKVIGPLAFRAGEVRVDRPLLLESPSADLQFAGRIDLARQRVDAQLVATLPVGGNLTAAAALAGGLPLAAGVWVASKLFQAPMDRFSSFRYTIAGPWADPKVKLDRAFEDRVDADAFD